MYVCIYLSIHTYALFLLSVFEFRDFWVSYLSLVWERNVRCESSFESTRLCWYCCLTRYKLDLVLGCVLSLSQAKVLHFIILYSTTALCSQLVWPGSVCLPDRAVGQSVPCWRQAISLSQYDIFILLYFSVTNHSQPVGLVPLCYRRLSRYQNICHLK